MHFFSCFCVLSTVLVCSWKILEYKLNSFHCKTVCVIRRHYRYICLKCVCKHVKTCVGSCRFRKWHYKLRVDNRNIRCQFVVCKRILHIILLIRNNRKTCYFTTCTGSCRNSYKLCLITHLRELKRTFSYIKETKSKWIKVYIRVFIEQPHTLCGVHCTASAKCDNYVRLKFVHHLCSAFYCFDWRVRLYIWENFTMNVLRSLS